MKRLFATLAVSLFATGLVAFGLIWGTGTAYPWGDVAGLTLGLALGLTPAIGLANAS